MPSAAELLPLLPELVLVGGAFALLMLDLFLERIAARGDAPAGDRAAAGDGVAGGGRYRRAGRRARRHVRPRRHVRRAQGRRMRADRAGTGLCMAVPAPARALQGRSRGADAVRRRRDDAADLRRQPGDGLPRPGDAGAVLVRACRHRSRQRNRVRSGDEIFRPRGRCRRACCCMACRCCTARPEPSISRSCTRPSRRRRKPRSC